MSPEVIKSVPYSFKADIWSLGITCIEMADGKPPYAEISPFRVIFIITSKPPPQLSNPGKWSPEFNNFIASCLVPDPNARPSSKDLLEHPFITKGNNVPMDRLKELATQCLPAIIAHREELAREPPKPDDVSVSMAIQAATPGTQILLKSEPTGTTVITDAAEESGTTVFSSSGTAVYSKS
ncbi:STE/STE20/MST protein kinase [Pelomyxa schiedti]|nr:STE/STE20/MST protein kinase [Pelomyxa schiedti]